MTTMYLIRHGQSKANEEKFFAGHTDVPLTRLGEQQAEKTAQYIAENFKIDAVYASDLERAFVTGKAVADKMGVPVFTDRGLREIYAGQWEGILYEQLLLRFPDTYSVWKNNIGLAQCPDGESVAQLQQRFLAALRRIAADNDGKAVAVATHACAIRTLCTYCAGKDLSEMRDIAFVSNASVTTIEFQEGDIRLVRQGYDDHLGDIRISTKNFAK